MSLAVQLMYSPMIRHCRPLLPCFHLPIRLASSANPVFNHANKFTDRTAIVDTWRSYTYGELHSYAAAIASSLQGRRGARVGLLAPSGGQHVAAQWGIWMAGAVAVPLCSSHPPASIKHCLSDSGAEVVLSTACSRHKVEGLGVEVQEVGEPRVEEGFQPVEVTKEDAAMVLYTSGTTGLPKGVVLTHGNLENQAGCLLEPWGWSKDDRLLHVLPLHHTHGLVNCLLCPLTVGASVTMLDSFSAAKVWEILTSEEAPINLFFAVPTIYAKLVEHHRTAEMAEDQTVAALTRNLRLCVSGSAALPTPLLKRWREVSGHTLLERYGMTEIGMALSNPLEGKRMEGCVGSPLPGVQARIVRWDDQDNSTILAEGDQHKVSPVDSEEGELLIRGPNVFREYWGKPEATAKEFTSDGWFRTGDTSKVEGGIFRILGRTSVDIIKSGGYKISALDIERVLLAHLDITDAAVLGVEDPTWGQKVAAVLVLRSGSPKMGLEEVKKWVSDKLPSYQAPREVRILSVMPRNAMGKVNKKELLKTVFEDQISK